MTFSGVEWTILWKLHHLRFFWIYFIFAVPLKGALTWHIGVGSTVRKGACAVLSSFASAVLNVWFPILPIVSALLLNRLIGAAAGHSLLVSLSVVALSMGAEAALLDWLLFRIWMKASVNPRLVSVLIANMLNAAVALAVGLTWVVPHPTMMTAAATYLRLTMLALV